VSKDKPESNIKKKAMIEALTKSLGIVTQACAKIGINRKTHYQWLKEDEQYKADCEAIHETTLDFVESKLYQNIKEGRESSIFYFLNNRGGSRGYSKIQQIAIDSLEKIDLPKIEITVKK
jgi:hypothetical protein